MKLLSWLILKTFRNDAIWGFFWISDGPKSQISSKVFEVSWKEISKFTRPIPKWKDQLRASSNIVYFSSNQFPLSLSLSLSLTHTHTHTHPHTHTHILSSFKSNMWMLIYEAAKCSKIFQALSQKSISKGSKLMILGSRLPHQRPFLVFRRLSFVLKRRHLGWLIVITIVAKQTSIGALACAAIQTWATLAYLSLSRGPHARVCEKIWYWWMSPCGQRMKWRR